MSKKITIRMPKEHLKLWLAALRLEENQNKQGRNALFSESDGGYCCLGVAQCVVTGGFVQVYPKIHERVDYRGLPSPEWMRLMGWDFYSRSGSSECDPFLPSLDMYASVANDEAKLSFSEIADAIEACAEGY